MELYIDILHTNVFINNPLFLCFKMDFQMASFEDFSTMPNSFQNMIMNEGGFMDEKSRRSRRRTRGKTRRSFIAECSKCHKWRKLPCKAKYSELRKMQERNIPFYCEKANWRMATSCSDPSDILFQDDESNDYHYPQFDLNLNAFKPVF